MAEEPDGGDPWKGAGLAYTVMGLLLSGVLVWGGIGYLFDRLIGTHRVFLPIGMVVGAAGATYLVYIRYGRNQPKT